MKPFIVLLLLFAGLAPATAAQSVSFDPQPTLVLEVPPAEVDARPVPVQGTVTGTVTDAGTGQPIAAVQMSVVGTGLGGLTNADGRYLIANVPDGPQTLRAERVGYATVDVAVTIAADQTLVQDFLLSEQAFALDEIVVTGVPGGTRRRAIGNSVSTVEAAAITELAPVEDVQTLLRGRTPSVNMMGGGMVGQGPRMRIRGASTFSLNGQPLIYIDGVRANNDETTGYTFGNNAGVRSILTSLDPEQIERIEVLKGPAAATLYGTEASRGVINVITKRGQEGGARVDLMVRQGVNWMADKQGKVGYDNYWTDPSSGQIHTLNMLDYHDGLGNDIYTPGSVQAYSASLSGGSADTRYFLSGTYADETGILNYNWQKKFNLRTNIETELSDNLGLAVNMGYTNSRDRLVRDGFGSITEGVEFGSPRLLPEHWCRTSNNSFGCGLLHGYNRYDMPVRDETNFNHQYLNRFTGGLTFNHEALGFLTTRFTSGIDFTGEQNVAFREYQTSDTAVVSLGANNRRGFRNEGHFTHFRTTTDFSTTANLNVSSALTTSTSVGVQYYTRTTTFLSATGQQFAGPGLSTITSTSIPGVPANNRISDNTLGTYVQETLGWNDRLFLTGAVRVDNNSAFGNDIRFVTYPKASLSWVMNEEGWFQDSAPAWLNTLRFRLAWGESGEQPASFSALRTWAAVTGPRSTAGVTPNTVGNPDLTAEVGQETEVGFDADLLDSRLGLQFTYYSKLTRGAILERDLPPSSGFTGAQFVNAGEITNSGFEVSLDAQLVETSGLSWDVGLNFSSNSSEILQLSGEAGDTSIVFNSWSSMEHRVGHPPYSWFGVDVVSSDLDANGNTVNAQCSDGQGGTTPCFDAGGTTIAPRVFLGRAIAPYEISLTSDIAVGNNLRFHVLITSEQGHKRFDNTLRQRCRLYRVCRSNHHPQEWDPIMKATVESSDQIIDSWVNDVSFIRLKAVSMTYDLPEQYRFGSSRAVLQIAAQHLFTLTDWTASDPEVMFSSGGRAFMAQNNLPLPQQITASVRFSF